MLDFDITEDDLKEEEYDNSARRYARGLTFKIIRKEKRMTQKDMAKLLECNLTYYCQFENGNRDVNMRTMDKWLDKLGIGMLGVIF